MSILKKATIRFIELYQLLFSKELFGYRYNPCVFYPTCSEYSKQAILKYGVLKGLLFTGKRILRCHPKQKNIIDPIT